jgi:hypothetical protein
MTQLPTFQEMRREAYAKLGDVEDILRSDWRSGTGPTTEEADAGSEARRYIAKAKAALNRAAR